MSKRAETIVPLATILLIGVVYTLIVVWLPSEVFWITDGGNKFIQVQSMHLSGLPDVSIQYPAQEIDSDLTFFPHCGHHFKSVGDNIYSFYPPYFPLVSLIFFHFLGVGGIYVIPLLASTGCLVLTLLIVRQLGRQIRSTWALLILAFCSPLLFYSVTFWEHSLAMMFSTFCILLVVRSRESRRPKRLLLFAGIVLGLSTVFREEGYLLLAAIALGVAYVFPVRRNVVFLLIGWFLVMIPIWMIQHHLYDHFLGIHAVIYSSSLASPGDALSLLNPANTVSNWFVYLFKFHSSPQFSLLLAMPFIAALAVGLFCQSSRMATTARLTLIILSCVTSTILLMLLLSREDMIFDTLFTQALLPSTPFLVFFVLYFRSNMVSDDANLRFFTTTALIFLIGSGFLLNQKDVGIIWGPRHFISLYPILVPLTLIAIHQLLKDVGKRFDKRLVGISAGLLIGISLLVQLQGVHALVLKKTGTQAIVDSINELDTNVLVTDVFWLPEEIASVYYDKKILMVGSDEELESLLELFRTKNIKTFGFVTSKDYRRVSDKALQEMAPLFKEKRSVASPGMAFMSLRVFSCRL